MAEGQPVRWGSIDAEIAKRAEALFERADRTELKRSPFDVVVIEEELQAITDVKKEVEEVCWVSPCPLGSRKLMPAQKIRTQAVAWEKACITVTWGKPHVTKKSSARTLFNKGSTRLPGFVILSDLGNLPWGTAGERGGIYTWGQEMKWRWEEEDCYLLTFNIKEQS
jgi:hypothetical protein